MRAQSAHMRAKRKRLTRRELIDLALTLARPSCTCYKREGGTQACEWHTAYGKVLEARDEEQRATPKAAQT